MDNEPFPDSMLVTIDDDVFGPGVDWRTVEDMDDRDASWVVFSADARAAAEALHRAAPKFYSVDENGDIVSTDSVDFNDEYTPNYVSDVRVFDAGAYVYVDTKSMFFPPMARTMMRLIIAEVDKLGVPVRIGNAAAEDYYERGVDYAEALPPE
jgi:hypothetical protein